MSMRAQTESTHQTNRITELLLNFCRCGIAGWCLEVMFTSVDSIMAGDWRLMGRTSLIMFPIYGMGALLFPISRLIDSWLAGLPGFEDAGADRISRLARAVRHGLIYMVLIFIAEYTFMSIQYPTIFSLGIKNLGQDTKYGSSFIVMCQRRR